MHTDETSFAVKTEADSDHITEHSHDDTPRPYVCTVCDKRFTQKRSLNEHKLIHSGGMLYPCTQCGKRFVSQSYLNLHKNLHTSRYKCTECGKHCRCSRDLAVHSRIHSGEKPIDKPRPYVLSLIHI